MPTTHVERRRTVTWLILSISVLLSAMLLMMTMVGCDRGGGSANSAGKLRLVVWGKPSARDTREAAIWLEMVRQFEQAHPDIVVHGIEENYEPDRFVAQVTGGSGPDVVPSVYGVDINTLASKGFLANLEPYIKQWEHDQRVRPNLWELVRVNGQRYGVPSAVSPVCFLWRKDRFKEVGLDPDTPPANWDELVQYAVKLTDRANSRFGFGYLGGWGAGWAYIDFVWRAGGDVVEQRDGRWVATFDESAGVKALEFLRSLRWEHNVLQPDVLANREDLMRLFVAGQIAMAQMTPSALARALRQFPEFDLNQVGIGPLPTGPGGLRTTQMTAGVSVVLEKKDPARTQAAWKYIAFTADPKWQIQEWKLRHEAQLPLPLAASIYKDVSPADHVPIPVFSGIEQAIESARLEPNPPQWNFVKRGLQDPVQAVLTDAKADPQTVLSAFAKRCNEQFARIQN